MKNHPKKERKVDWDSKDFVQGLVAQSAFSLVFLYVVFYASSHLFAMPPDAW